MKYKVGDLIKIKTWKRMEKEYGLTELGYINCSQTFTTKMENDLNKYAPNRIVKISEICGDCYHIENSILSWTDDMIECLVKPEIYKSITSRFELLDIR